MTQREPLVRIFCYGTLLFPEVMRAVTGGEFASIPATASGWARYRVRGEVFPALVPEAGARTPGAVFSGLDARSLAALDAFEGPLYARRILDLECADGARVEAHAWVLAAGCEAEVTRESWDPEAFACGELRAYLAQVAASGSPDSLRSCVREPCARQQRRGARCGAPDRRVSAANPARAQEPSASSQRPIASENSLKSRAEVERPAETRSESMRR